MPPVRPASGRKCRRLDPYYRVAAGLVRVRGEGRQRFYRLNGCPLQPIHEWVKNYQRSWEDSFEALDEVLEELKAEEGSDGDNDE